MGNRLTLFFKDIRSAFRALKRRTAIKSLGHSASTLLKVSWDKERPPTKRGHPEDSCKAISAYFIISKLACKAVPMTPNSADLWIFLTTPIVVVHCDNLCA